MGHLKNAIRSLYNYKLQSNASFMIRSREREKKGGFCLLNQMRIQPRDTKMLNQQRAILRFLMLKKACVLSWTYVITKNIYQKSSYLITHYDAIQFVFLLRLCVCVCVMDLWSDYKTTLSDVNFMRRVLKMLHLFWFC